MSNSVCSICYHEIHEGNCYKLKCNCFISEYDHPWLNGLKEMQETLDSGKISHELIRCVECISMLNLYMEYQRLKINDFYRNSSHLIRRRAIRKFQKKMKKRRKWMKSYA